jgi:CubicO group peptidase (beta-lactamase class C family)
MVLENATNKSISKFFEEYLWKQIGTSHDALFSLDSRKNRFEKVETGLIASAIDLAKFGRLYLKNGSWNGRQIIDTSWIRQSAIIDTILLQKGNYYGKRMSNNNIAYRYGWWQKYDENFGCQAFWAAGFLGQFIWIEPEKHLIIVRLGKNKGGIDWNEFLISINEQCCSERPES